MPTLTWLVRSLSTTSYKRLLACLPRRLYTFSFFSFLSECLTGWGLLLPTVGVGGSISMYPSSIVSRNESLCRFQMGIILYGRWDFFFYGDNDSLCILNVFFLIKKRKKKTCWLCMDGWLKIWWYKFYFLMKKKDSPPFSFVSVPLQVQINICMYPKLQTIRN